MIFLDTTLKAMSRQYPINKEMMLQISGVVEYKLNKYGQRFIDVITTYVREHGITITSVERINKLTKSAPRDSHLLTYELYTQGKTIEEIADERDLTQTTVENHLLKCIKQDLEIDFNQFIPSEYEQEIIEAIQQCGTALLKPIKECLPPEVSYTAIKFTLAKYELQNK